MRSLLPSGDSLPEEVWWQRHRGILVLLWLHVPVVLTVAIAQGVGLPHAVVETSAVAGLAALATASTRHRALSMVIAAVGLAVRASRGELRQIAPFSSQRASSSFFAPRRK